MKENDKVILCISQPDWIYAAKYKKYGQLYDESDLLYLQNEILSGKNIDVKVYLSGDLHHYRRHEEISAGDRFAKVQKITAGGGGAFLHPTHDSDVELISEDYGINKKSAREFKLKSSYPEPSVSKRLTFQDLLFLFKNPGFGILPAALYLFTAWIVASSIGFRKPSDFIELFTLTVAALKNNPFAALWIFIITAAFVLFTDTHSKLYKWAGGILHALAHFTGIFYVTLAAIIVGRIFFEDGNLQLLFIAVIIFVLGWIIGSTILGIYLFISQYFFGRHNEEAFSALKIQDYKNFLRMHISSDGTLTIYPVKIENVPRKWRDRRSDESNSVKSFVVPVDGSKPELIEEPITIKF